MPHIPAALLLAAGALAATAAATAGGNVEIAGPLASAELGNSRQLRVYLPPSYASAPQRRYPVLYMHDGQNLFDPATAAYGMAWEIAPTMDRLIAAGEIEEAIVVGIDNSPERLAEYTPCCDPQHGGGRLAAYERFVVDTVKPYADLHWRTLPGREHTAIMGSSLGGIASVLIAQHRPDVFSMAGGVSSSFWWNRRALVDHPPARLPVRFYLDAGTRDDGLEDSELMHAALLRQGYRDGEDVLFHRAEGGSHNEKSWAARVDLPLKWFFRVAPAR